MLGADSIIVDLAGEAFELRPSLRACMRLVRRHQLHGLLVAAQDFNTTIIGDMLQEAGIKPSLLMAEIAAIGLGTVRSRFSDPLAEFVLAVAGIDPANTKPRQPVPGKAMTLEQYHVRLFQIATGWVGWTPEQAWNATAAEIVAAHGGHIERLQAIYGKADAPDTVTPYTAEQVAEIQATGMDPAFDREGLRALKARMSA